MADVRYEVVGSVARVTIDRPERRNAMSYGVMQGLRDAVAQAKADDAVRVLVLTGAGEKAFCAGADLGSGGIADGASAAHDGRGMLADMFRDLWDLGPVRVRQGESAVVVADRRSVDRDEMRRLSTEADLAVSDVDRVWRADWSRQPLVLVPHSQRDMATLLGDDGTGLAQIAAVTTGSVAEGLTRGDGPDGCQVISADQARKIAQALTQAGIEADYDSQRGGLGFSAAGSLVHSFPALPHKVAC